MRNTTTRLHAILLASACTSPSLASIQEYTSKTQWQQDASQFTTLTFTELPVDTLITNQYSPQGVLFTDGSDFVYSCSCFLTDGVGVNGAFDTIVVSFTQAMNSIAVDFPGLVQFDLYNNGQHVYTSNEFGGGGSGFFGGLITDFPFDSAVIFDPSGGVVIDNLYFGPPIPAPGMLAILSLTGLCFNRRRR